MPCTTILVGKKASYNGATLIARNDDGFFTSKKMVVVNPKDQPKKYKSVISHLEIELPDNPLRYTACPNVDLKKEGIWAAFGINEANVAMTATETITSNARVLGADPYVRYEPKKGKEKEKAGGIGEEDLVTIVLPYIRSARDGVLRVKELLEKYGTYEPNGMAFSDEKEIWWLETIGGHHFIARRVKDDEYVMMPNQFGMDRFDMDDAYDKQIENICSSDLKDFIEKNHLDLNMNGEFNPRAIFGSRDDSDHIYNTPRAWFMGRYFNPRTYKWDGENADFTPESDDIPWALVPEKKISIEDVKYILSSYYQGTPYNPYAKGNEITGRKYRTIGTATTDCMGILEIRDYVPDEIKAVEWICFASNAFNQVVPVYTNTDKLPEYLTCTKMDVSTDNLHWNSRIIGIMADAHYSDTAIIIERYQKSVAAKAHALLNKFDEEMITKKDFTLIDKANEELVGMMKKETSDCLNKMVDKSLNKMKNLYNRGDN